MTERQPRTSERPAILDLFSIAATIGSVKNEQHHPISVCWKPRGPHRHRHHPKRSHEGGVEVINLRDLEEKLKSLLGGEYSSLTIGFNDMHACNYATAQKFHDEYYEYGAEGDEERDHGFIDFISEDERLKALRENSVWRIQWYPNTPVGFNCIGASSLEALIDGLEKMTQGPNQ